MCHGSRYRNDIRKYSPAVDAVETIKFVKMLFPRVKVVLVLSWDMTMYSAANVVYAMMTE